MARKVGRPRLDEARRKTTITTDPCLFDRLAALSKETGVSQNQLMVRFITIGLDLAEKSKGKTAA